MHIPVMLKETIDGLNPVRGGVYVDCTVNRASHASYLASKIGKDGVLVCVDLNKNALTDAKERLSSIDDCPTLYFVQDNYRNIRKILNDLNIEAVNGVVADLGLSSEELDSEGRGFSFRFDEPLLMTFHNAPTEDMVTAYDVVNSWSFETLSDVIYYFSDEQYARRIARAICERREVAPIKTTFELVDVILTAVPNSYKHKKTNPATKTFQAIRMAVNEELSSIEEMLRSLPEVLQPEGRASIITFHSTEDRLVKLVVRSLLEKLSFVSRKAIVPTDIESKENPRARSAQLRIIESI